LTVVREDLADLPARLPADNLPEDAEAFLAPSAFVQADHPEIRTLARELTDSAETPLVNLHRLVAWMQSHIERRPVLSVPNAVETLRNRMGDCNEHAVLLAALARAAGIPAQVEAGLVHLEDRFYYHAWNRVYLGRWVTVDALFNQIPADVSHIRFARGSAREQLDILPLVGNLRIRVVEMQ
jgi:transglutaminase-like putative cysteine protease